MTPETEGQRRRRESEAHISRIPGVHRSGELDENDISKASPDNPVTLRGGYETTDPRLDRVPEFDERSRNFPMMSVLEQMDQRQYKPRSYTWRIDEHLDQGREGACVGFAWTNELMARPAVVECDISFARWVYKTAQKYDYWSGESYEGTSTLAGAKVIQQKPPKMNEGRGFIGEYRWHFGDLDGMIKTAGYFGPFIFGTWWTRDMFKVDSNGFIRATGEKAGGHCYCIKGVSIPKKAFRVHNSWGANWGQGGDAWLSWDDALKLLDDDGECCVPMRRYTIE